MIDYRSIAGLIDHAILHPTLTDEQVRAEIEALREEPLASLCVKPSAVAIAAQMLAGCVPKVCTVIGFPHGTVPPEGKAFEAELACKQGATELDMVINTGKALSGDWKWIKQEIEGVKAVVRAYGALVKVIFEIDFLPEAATKIRLCEICAEAGADFVKTSTGFGFVKASGGYDAGGATDEDLTLMRKYSPPNIGVKASGGVRDLKRVLRVLELGVTRVGTSSTRAILREAREKLS